MLMERIIWRSRASAILGVLVMALPFTGFPQYIKYPLFFIFGLLIVLLGLTGSRRGSLEHFKDENGQA